MKLEESQPQYGAKHLRPSDQPHQDERRQPVVARDLLRVDQKDRQQYEPCQFSLPHLTAYSISWLATWEIPTTYENISVLNARLFPAEFALPGFPELPDAMRTNRTLLQMRPKYRGFAASDPRRGVFLSDKGRQAAAKVLEIVGVPTLEGKPVENSIVPDDRVATSWGERTRKPAQIISDCRSKLLYRRFAEGRFEETDIVHFLGLVSLYDHTPPSELRKAMRQLRADAHSTGDKAFLVFLDQVEERFSAYLDREEK